MKYIGPIIESFQKTINIKKERLKQIGSPICTIFKDITNSTNITVTIKQ